MKDISLHILDIANNSVSAKAQNIIIQIHEDMGKDLMSILIQDDGRGMPAEVVQRVTDPYYTSRTTRKVGLGLPLFKQNAEMTGGSLSVESEPGRGTVVRAKFGLNHIDRPPLGDMPGVLMLLVSGYPDVDWYYKYSRGDKEYVFDTKEVKEALDGLPLTEPSVIKYLKEMVRENLLSVK